MDSAILACVPIIAAAIVGFAVSGLSGRAPYMWQSLTRTADERDIRQRAWLLLREAHRHGSARSGAVRVATLGEAGGAWVDDRCCQSDDEAIDEIARRLP